MNSSKVHTYYRGGKHAISFEEEYSGHRGRPWRKKKLMKRSNSASRLSLNRLLAKTRSWRKRSQDTASKGNGCYYKPTSAASDADWSPSSQISVGSTSVPYYDGGSSPDSWGKYDELSPIYSFSNRDNQILENLFKLLGDSDPAVREKALATVFHLTQSSPFTRNTILEAGGLYPILNEIQRGGPNDSATARALFHLCVGDPPPPFNLVVQTIPSLQRLLISSDDEEVLIIICYVLSELVTVTDVHSPSYINKVIPPPVHPRLTALLTHESMDVKFRALNLLEKICRADRFHGPKRNQI